MANNVSFVSPPLYAPINPVCAMTKLAIIMKVVTSVVFFLLAVVATSLAKKFEKQFPHHCNGINRLIVNGAIVGLVAASVGSFLLALLVDLHKTSFNC